MRHLESSYELVAKLILKDFRVSFLYFFYTKKMLVKFTNIKKYRAKIKRLITKGGVTKNMSHPLFPFTFLRILQLQLQDRSLQRFLHNDRIDEEVFHLLLHLYELGDSDRKFPRLLFPL